MDRKQFIADIVKSLSWPIVIVLIFILFRGQVDNLIVNTSKFTCGSFQLSFSKEVSKIRNEIHQLAPTLKYDPDKSDRLRRTATSAPSLAIIEAWKEVKVAATQFILKREPNLKLNPSTPYKELGSLLLKHKAVNDKQIKIFDDLRLLRNKVKYAPQYEVTSDQALEYVNLALTLADYLSNK